MVLELTDKNYTKIIEETETAIFIDFFSPSCGPCQTLMTYMDKINDYGIENNVLVLKCDVSKNPKIAAKYQIQSVPFTCIVNQNKEIKYPDSGLKDIAYYISLISKFNPNKKSFFQKLFNL